MTFLMSLFLLTCTTVGHTPEGFPAVACDNGRTYYADLDGDGLDARTNGRWIEIDPAYIVED